MDHYQKKEQNYTKWNEEIWLSVEKEISNFQLKVTDCMLALGDLKKRNLEDFKVEPCLDDDVILGEEFYLQNIRPQCVKKGYLPKKQPTKQDLSDDEDDDDSESESEKQQTKEDAKKQKQKPAGNKKGGKKAGKGKNNQEQMKMKIVQENLKKDIEMVLNSHSLERMQVEFGLKHKKLEVKLITFFYVAFYIRKNKETKKIQESEIFELINILIKIVRIFDGFKGKSFLASDKNQDEMIEVSQTLILDLKMCIKGFREYYRYSNRKIIINYPKLVYYTNYDRFFPTLDIKPYPSQIQFIQAVKKALNEKASIANPTLILYRTMIGSGKTSASIALSNLIVESKMVDQKNNDLQLIYSCLIGSVRVQVGRYAYNKEQKFALAAMQRSIKNQEFYYPRIINSYSCRDKKIVDLVISDLDCTYEMLNYHKETARQKDIFDHERKERKKVVNVGKLERENLILFIDEPTAFCKSVDSPATQKLFEILANYPPKLIILASATMPDASMLPKTIKLIGQKNPKLQVFQVESKEFQIGCQFCSFKGEVIFPHTNLKNKEDISNIIKLLEKNPFLLRLYTGPSLFFLLKRCQQAGVKNLPKIDQWPEVRQGDIIKATFRILKILNGCENDVITEVCRLAADQTNLDYKIEDDKSDSDDDFNFLPKKNEEEMMEQEIKEKEEEKKDFVDFKRILKSDAHKFLGGCLIGTDNPLEFAKRVFDKWVRKIKPIKRLMQKYRKNVEQLEKEIKLILDDKQKREEKKTKEISKLESQKEAIIEFPDKKRINTIDHYKKYCKNKESTHLSMLIKPVPLESVGEEMLEEVDDFVLKLLFCGVALYMEKGLSPKYLDKVEELASQNYLAFIITDQSLCYGTNFPISNVILCDDLAEKLNMNEMFQLIGRAGRVGQSWTARAFLQPKGLKMLDEYIHDQDKAVSLQASVFEEIAQQHLDKPELAYRSSISEIRYVDIENPDSRIQVEIKKKKQDSHLFKNVVLIPFTKDGRIICKKLPYQSLNYYEFLQSEISYDDIPTKLNSHEQNIIDVEGYYLQQPKFIKNLLNRTVKRILSQNKIDSNKIQQLNQFKPKVYEDYFNTKTNTFTVLIKCQEGFQFDHEGFKLQKMDLKNETTLHVDEIMLDKLKDFNRYAMEINNILEENPSGVLQNDVTSLRKLHNEFMEREKMKFYQDIYNHHLPQMKAKYEKMIERFSDKNSIECKSQSIIALLGVERGDFINVNHLRFAVDYHVRDIWNVIQREIEKK